MDKTPKQESAELDEQSLRKSNEVLRETNANLADDSLLMSQEVKRLAAMVAELRDAGRDETPQPKPEIKYQPFLLGNAVGCGVCGGDVILGTEMVLRRREGQPDQRVPMLQLCGCVKRVKVEKPESVPAPSPPADPGPAQPTDDQ